LVDCYGLAMLYRFYSVRVANKHLFCLLLRLRHIASFVTRSFLKVVMRETGSRRDLR
jgi:hypothetical protein